MANLPSAPARPLLGHPLSALLALTLATGPSIVPSPALAQPKPTVSVPEFKNNVTQSTWWWKGPVASDLASVLANELQGTGQLQVVERSSTQAVLSEQEMVELGLVRKGPNAARRGQMTGARYIVLGTVTSYESNAEEVGRGSSFGLLGFGKNNAQVETKDYVAIDIRVVDSSTGEIVGQRTVEGRASNVASRSEQGVNLLPAAGAALFLFPNMGRTGQALTGAAGTLNFGRSSSQVQRTPAAKAIRAALTEASEYVACVLVPRDNCLASFEAKDQLRKERNRGVLKLD